MHIKIFWTDCELISELTSSQWNQKGKDSVETPLCEQISKKSSEPFLWLPNVLEKVVASSPRSVLRIIISFWKISIWIYMNLRVFLGTQNRITLLYFIISSLTLVLTHNQSCKETRCYSFFQCFFALNTAIQYYIHIAFWRTD